MRAKGSSHVEAITCETSAEVQKSYYRYLCAAGKNRRHVTSLEVRFQQQQRQLYYAQQQRVCRKQFPPRSSAVALRQLRHPELFGNVMPSYHTGFVPL